MTDAERLTLVRIVHTAIYLVMAASSLLVLYAGLTGAHGRWLWVAATLVAMESLVFVAGGLKCPLTAVAVKYGATKGEVFDTFLPERITRHTFRVFGPIIVVAFALIAWRWWSAIWR